MIKNSHLVLNCVPNSKEPLQITLCRTHLFVFFSNDFKAKLSTVRPFSESSVLLAWSLCPMRWVSYGSDHSLLSYTLLVFRSVSVRASEAVQKETFSLETPCWGRGGRGGRGLRLSCDGAPACEGQAGTGPHGLQSRSL